MKNRIFGKIVAAGMAGAVMLQLMSSNLVLASYETASEHKKQGVDASALNVDVDFYDYNIKEYKGKKVSSDMKIALNEYVKEMYVGQPDSKLTVKDLFLFGGDRKKDAYGLHNSWAGVRKGQYEGIVAQELDENGNLKFNNANGIYGVNMFPQEGDTTLEDLGLVKAYYDTNFKFYNSYCE